MTVSLNHLSDLVRKRVAVAAYYFVPGVVFGSHNKYLCIYLISIYKRTKYLLDDQLFTFFFIISYPELGYCLVFYLGF